MATLTHVPFFALLLAMASPTAMGIEAVPDSRLNMKSEQQMAGSQASIGGQSGRIHHQCLAAIGHETFCACLRDNMPVFAADADFIFYVVVVNATKEELEYERMNETQRRVFDKTLETRDFWLLDYFPETRRSEIELNAPTPATIEQVLRVVEVRTLWVPRDCVEGFAAASWARPHDYLDPAMQEAISLFALADPAVRERGTARLRADLESGAWHDRYAELAELDRADFGYRLVIGRPQGKPLMNDQFHVPQNRKLDTRLIGGSAVFGIGWGIAGFCPGGALPAIGSLNPSVLIFVAAMIAGIFAAKALQSYTAARIAHAAA